MRRKNGRLGLWFVFIALAAMLLGVLVDQALAQEVKWMRIGSLQSWFREDGCEPEVGRTGLQSDQQDGFQWPAQYFKQDNVAAKALWIGTTNYTDADQYGGNTYPYKVVHIGPRGWDMQREFMPVEFKMIGRFDHPLVFVDGFTGSQLMWDDVVDEVDENLPADRMLYNVVNTSIGITMTRKILAWSQRYNDNYFIVEYVFKNTGNVDPDPEIERPNQTLENVWFFYQYRYAVSREGAEATGLNSPRWGINAMLSTRGEAPSDTVVAGFTYPGDYAEWLAGKPDADSLRCQFAWAGKHSSAQYDLIGYPDVRYGTGRLMGPQFIGVVTLHADKSATDKSDDPYQPRTTTYQQSDDPPTRPNDQFDAKRMADEWKWITRGHRLPRHDQVVDGGFPDQFEGTPGGFSNMNGYGPYTLGPGDSIRIVVAEAVNGLSREKCIEIGRQWYQAYINPTASFTFTLPDGSTTTDKDEFKDAWVMTGIDSLFKTFGRARRNFENGYKIPMPPPPPDYFEVKSGGDRIRLMWSTSAEDAPGFAGYRIYRAIAKYDTTFDLIYECGLGTDNPLPEKNKDGLRFYDDKDAQRGQSYYYYITTFDDGSINVGSPVNPSGVLESSMFWTRTIEPAYLRRQPVSDMDSIRVVPNPYNIRSRDLQYLGEPDKIMFLNIPGECTIRIYTERGDLIKTIVHNDGSGDESWNSTTDYGQVVVSGVYIIVFEKPNGEKKIRKLVIIR